MKKLLILIFTILSLGGYGQTRLELVNVGSGPGQGDGDPLRTAFIKTNSAINALDSLYGPGTAYIKFKGSTSGTVRVEAEAVAGTNKLTAPAETGTLATRANVTTQVNDSLNAIRAAATTAVVLADSGTYDGGYMSPRMVDVKQGGNLALFRALELLGGNVKGMHPYGANANGTTTMVDQTAYWASVYVPIKSTITGIKVINGSTQASFTGDNFNGAALYSVSGTTYTKIATTANNEALWKLVAYSLLDFPFTSSIVVDEGVYYVAFLYCDAGAGTAPAIATNQAMSNSVNNYLAGQQNHLHGTVATQTALPATETAGDLTHNAYPFAFWLY